MGRRGSEYRICAEVVEPRSTVVAASAWNARLNSYPVTNLDILDLGTYLDDDARTFVAEDDGALENEVAYPTSLPVMHVAAADARLFDMNANIVLVPEKWHCTVFKGNVFDRLEDESLVLMTVSVDAC